jgi:SAM-dependent methyltransferase
VISYDPATLEFYEREAEAYLSVRLDEPDADVMGFLDRLPAGARILELGCGGGREARAMIERGFDVDATDGVPAMAEQAGILLGRPVRVMRFDELNARSEYDAVIANAALLHVPLDALPAILARIARALKPGGWHWASYKTGGEAGVDEFGRYYNRLSLADAKHMYDAARDWAMVQFEEADGRGYFSKPARWLKVTAQRMM